MKAPTITVIGAGSPWFTPELMRSLVSRPALRGASVRLVDLSAERLQLMSRFGRWLQAGQSDLLEVTTWEDSSAALESADFVAVAAGVGGDRMRELDVQIPLRHGIVHVRGDTTGPAGIFRGLRGIPFLVGIAREMERRCPKAVLLNVSNPLTVLTRAVLRETRISAAGFCSCIGEMRSEFARILGYPRDRVDLHCIGVNHFTWMTGLYVDGRDVHDEFESKVVVKFREGLPVTVDLYDAYGAFPIPGYKYASEFFPWFLGASNDFGRKIGFVPDDMAARRASAESTLLLLSEEMTRSPSEVKRELSVSTEEVVDFIDAASTGHPRVINANVANHGRLAFEPAAAVIEGPLLASGQSVRPLYGGRLPAAVVELLHRVIAEQELVVEAGVNGNREALLEAFLLDPLVSSLSDARAIIEEMLDAEREFLPTFSGLRGRRV